MLVPDAGDLLSPSVQMLVCQISATPPQQPTQRLSVTVIELRTDAGEGLPTFIDDDEDADDGTGEVNTTIFVWKFLCRMPKNLVNLGHAPEIKSCLSKRKDDDARRALYKIQEVVQIFISKKEIKLTEWNFAYNDQLAMKILSNQQTKTRIYKNTFKVK